MLKTVLGSILLALISLTAAQAGAASPDGLATDPKVIKLTPGMTTQSLSGRPDSDLLEFSNGRRLSLGSLRRLRAAQQRMRAAQPGSRLAPALKQKPAATGTPVRTSADLLAALKRPGTETVQFPSGRRATVDQIKFLQPEVEKRLGRKISTLSSTPSTLAPPIRITNKTTKSDWKEILQQPDNTLLQAPDGKRLTVGALKLSLATTPKGALRKPAPAAGSPMKR